MVSNMFYFPFNIWDVSLPIDELIFFKIVSAPPTSKYLCIFYVLLSHHFHENTGPGVPSSNGPPHLFVQGILRDRGTLPRWVGTEDAAAGRRRIAVVGGGAQMMGKPWENHGKTIGKWRFTLWLCQQVAIENTPIIVSFPMKTGDFP